MSIAEIRTEAGDVLVVPLSSEDGRESARLVIDGVPYHFERVRREETKRGASNICLHILFVLLCQ